jgi:ElaB/YqjD/DUF883 family membrane-anchored ribosome-binding protein
MKKTLQSLIGSVLVAGSLSGCASNRRYITAEEMDVDFIVNQEINNTNSLLNIDDLLKKDSSFLDTYIEDKVWKSKISLEHIKIRIKHRVGIYQDTSPERAEEFIRVIDENIKKADDYLKDKGWR